MFQRTWWCGYTLLHKCSLNKNDYMRGCVFWYRDSEIEQQGERQREREKKREKYREKKRNKATLIEKLCFFNMKDLLGMVEIRVGSDIWFGRISGRIPDIEIIQYCPIFSLTLLKLSGWMSNNFFFISNKIDIIRPDIRPNRISNQP